MIIVTSAAQIEKIEDVLDKKGAPWVRFRVKRSWYESNPFEAYSQYYSRSELPRVLGGSDLGSGYEIDEYASTHSRFGKSPELPHTDVNGALWIWMFETGTLDDNYFAVTKSYGGTIIEADSEAELFSAISSYAKKFGKSSVSKDPLPVPGDPNKPLPPKPPPATPPGPVATVEALPASEDDTIRKGWALASDKHGSAVALAQVDVAIGWMESGLGTKGQFLLPNNIPSWNWGAVVAREGQPYFQGTMRFSRFNTMREGYENFLTIPSLKLAYVYFEKGDVLGGVSVMYDHHYFVVDGDGRTASERERHVRDYAAAVMGSAGKVASVTGQKNLLHMNGQILPPPPGTPEESNAGTMLVAGGLAAIGIWALTRK